MGMDINETRRDHRPIGINLTASPAVHTANLRDPAAGDSHISGAARGAGPVDHDAAPNHQIVLGHRHVLSRPHISEHPP